MADAPIELATSELYHRHKRNLLFFASITIVLSLAQHKDGLWKLPGTEAEVRAIWAYLLLAAAISYSAAQYLSEFLAVRARNAEGWAEVKASRLDQALEVQADRAEERTQQFDALTRNLHQHMTGFTRLVDGAESSVGSVISKVEESYVAWAVASADLDPRNHAPLDAWMEEAKARQRDVHELRELLGQVTTQAELVAQASEASRVELSRIAQDTGVLRSKFSQLSRFIHSGQRLGMIWLDGVTPALMTALALGICAWQSFSLLGR